MSDALLKYQCPACGAPLEFSPEKQLLVCDSCDSEFPEDVLKDKNEQEEGMELPEEETREIDWNIEGFVRKQAEGTPQDGFACTSCGAEVLSNGATVATECMYCGNPIVLSHNISGMVEPDLILPFKITKEEAERKLKAFYQGKPLLPSAFHAKNLVSKVSGVYVPFWLFSCSGSGRVYFEATRSRSWSDSQYRYTETSHYNILRGGSLGFSRIPVDASTKMDDHYMDGIEPYDYNEIIDFEPMYMAGYFADKFDVDVKSSAERASERVIASVEDSFRGTVQGYATVSKKNTSVQMQGEGIQYALLPVWMLNTKYKGKMYQFAINGQTGKVAGELPIDKTKLLLWRLGVGLLTAAPVAALLYWLWS